MRKQSLGGAIELCAELGGFALDKALQQELGVDKAQFTQVFNSFAIAGKVRRANQLQDAYEVEATPSLGIAGRYYVPGQAARILTIANALIQEARKG